MRIAVRYFTRSGNTKKVADAIASAVGASSAPLSSPVKKPVDLLFLGGSVYGFGVDDALKAFVSELDPELVKKVAVFSTSAVVPSGCPQIKKLVDEKGIPLAKEDFHCRGKFAFLHSGRPNSDDLKAVATFAKNAAKE
jgi:flavodoxin